MLSFNFSNNINYKNLRDIENKNEILEKLKDLVPIAFNDNELDLEKLKQILGLENNLEQSEKYGLNWAGKSKAFYETTKISTKTLVPQRDKSLNFDDSDNIIIEGDNLEVLRLLEKSYCDKVDVIYIDPPYNTGNDFVYNDDFKQTKKEFDLENNLIDEEGNKVQTKNQKSDGKFHTNWLNMMYPRLILARKLLKDDGVIFISIDDNEQARLKMMCDEIFGEQNFQNSLCWISNRSGRQISNNLFCKTYEFIHVYSKLNEQKTIEFDRKKISKLMPLLYSDEDVEVFEDEISTYMIQYELHNQNINKFNSNTRPNLYYPIYTNGEKISLVNKNGYVEILPPKSNSKQGVWRWSKEKVENEKHNLIIKEMKGKYKIFPKKRNLVFSAKDLIFSQFINTKTGSNEMKELKLNFDYPKPSKLLKFLLSFSKPNSLILDFFAGSGTTGQAVMELNKEDGGNRKYILVQYPEKSENLENTEFETIADITRERIKRSINLYGYKEKGFKAFKLVDSHLKTFEASSNESNESIQQKLFDIENKIQSNTSTEELIYEIILRMGSLPLDTKIYSQIIANNKIYYNESKYYLFMLEPTQDSQHYENIIDVVKQFYNDNDLKIFLNDQYFKNDQDKINFAEEIKNISKEKIELVVI